MTGRLMGEEEQGVPAASRSLIYRSPRAYRLAMLLLYGQKAGARQRALAELIRPGTSVVEACCGPGTLYSAHLQHKDVRYTGLDLSPAFVSMLQGKGIDARLWDLRSDAPLPHADFVVMQASLYHFLPDPKPIVDRMLEAARAQVIIAEPIHNLTSDHPNLGRLFAALTNAGAGPERRRFDERSLDGFFNTYRDRVRRVIAVAGGREKLYALAGKAKADSPAHPPPSAQASRRA